MCYVRRMCRNRLVWLNTNLQATNTTVEMDCPTKVTGLGIVNILISQTEV